MNAMIETLEDRMMFSTTPVHSAPPAVGHAPAVHAPKAVPVAPMHFKGTAFNTTQNKLAANLTMTLTKNDKGYLAEIIAADPNGSAPIKFSAQVDANGHFSADISEGGGKKLHVEGQLNADKSAVAGNWTETRKDGSSVGTFSVARTDNTNVVPPAAPLSGSHYVGSAADSGGTTSGLTMDIVKTNDGSTFGIIKHTDPHGTVDTVTVKFDANGHFVYNGDIASKLHLEGQMSANASSCTGSYTSSHKDAPTTTGVFTLTRS